jgi:hypothetical protein
MEPLDFVNFLGRIWSIWVGIFPPNAIFGTSEMTASAAFVALVLLIGWGIGKTFGDGPGIR